MVANVQLRGAHDVFAAAIRARSGEMRKADFISAPPVREGWVSVPRYATQKQINAMAKLDLPNTPYCEIYAAAITASEEGRNENIF